MFFYFLYRIGYFLANKLPLGFAYWLSERFSDIQYLVFKKDGEAVAENLSIVLQKDLRECRVLARKVFRNFGMYLVDFFRMDSLTEDDLKRRVKVEGLKNLDNALKKNKGAIVLSCHIGSWEMGGVVAAMLGYDISVVALNHMHKKINDFFIGQREKQGVKVITTNFIMKRCVSALLRNGLLALLGDRDFTNSGMVLNFFGVPTSIPKGPAMLSLKTGALIVPVFFIRENRYGYKFIFETPIEAVEGQGISDTELARKTTERFIPVMENYIKKYPDQWLLFRRFWETPADAFVF